MRTFSIAISLLTATSAALFGCNVSMSTSTATGPAPSPEPSSLSEPDRTGRAAMSVFSPPLYQSFVSRSMPYDALAEQARRAAVPAELHVREVDVVGDDYYRRTGTVVLLGKERGALVGFTTRYTVDIGYPDTDLVQDGVGAPDFEDGELTLAPPNLPCFGGRGKNCVLQFTLTKAAKGPLRFAGGSQAYYRIFGDNDAVLLYFPPELEAKLAKARVSPLGLDRPSDALAEALSDATRLLGKEFVLISPESLTLLRKHAGKQSIAATYGTEVLTWAAGLLGATTVVKALLSKAVSHLALNRRALAAAVTYTQRDRYRAQILDHTFDFATALDSARSGTDLLPPMYLAEIPREISAEVAHELAQMLAGARVQAIRFGTSQTRADDHMLFVPSRYLNLNYELIRNGMARLRMDQEDALRQFPEFVDAARLALLEGAGYAAVWRDDGNYTASVEHAHARLSRRSP